MSISATDFAAAGGQSAPTRHSRQIQFADVFDEQHSDPRDGPEIMVAESLNMMRPRSMSHHLSQTKVPSRRLLKIKAHWWRSLMQLGMYFHDFAPPPKAPKPSFVRKLATDTIPIQLLFYLPDNYHTIMKETPEHRFPVVINFHGGGFVLGDATDDRYWARIVLRDTPAIFVSVNYRRAPEHPFPIPVDDCVDSVLYIAAHADGLHIDPHKIAMSGFSAGANLACAVPLRLRFHHKTHPKPSKLSPMPSRLELDSDSQYNPNSSSQVNLNHTQTTQSHAPSSHFSHFTSTPSQSTASLPSYNPDAPQLTILSIAAWYPLLDWTQSRASKTRTSRNPAKSLPKTFTDLFDFSYLPPPDMAGDHCSPYASPGLAPDHMLKAAIPHAMQLWLCEWDMLLGEGQRFSERLEALGKNVYSRIIPGVPHGFDKSPNPWRNQAAIDLLYEKCARGLREVFEGIAPETAYVSNMPSEQAELEEVSGLLAEGARPVVTRGESDIGHIARRRSKAAPKPMPV